MSEPTEEFLRSIADRLYRLRENTRPEDSLIDIETSIRRRIGDPDPPRMDFASPFVERS